MAALDFKIFDGDNHYYEAEDAFTRHMDSRMQRRCMQWAEIRGRKSLLVAGQVNRFIPNPTFDPVAKPGCLDDYYQGKNAGALSIKEAFGDLEPIRPEYRDRDARLRVMDEQGVEGALFFPTLGVGMEEALYPDTEAVHAAFRAAPFYFFSFPIRSQTMLGCTSCPSSVSGCSRSTCPITFW